MSKQTISVNDIVNEASSSSFKCGSSVKSLIFLFIIVIFVLSTAFNNYVIASFKGSMNDAKEITSYGVMIEAVCIVMLYALINCLDNYNIL